MADTELRNKRGNARDAVVIVSLEFRIELQLRDKKFCRIFIPSSVAIDSG